MSHADLKDLLDSVGWSLSAFSQHSLFNSVFLSAGPSAALSADTYRGHTDLTHTEGKARFCCLAPYWHGSVVGEHMLTPVKIQFCLLPVCGAQPSLFLSHLHKSKLTASIPAQISQLLFRQREAISPNLSHMFWVALSGEWGGQCWLTGEKWPWSIPTWSLPGQALGWAFEGCAGGKQDIRDRPNKQTCQPQQGPLTSLVPSVFLSTLLLILRTSDTSPQHANGCSLST